MAGQQNNFYTSDDDGWNSYEQFYSPNDMKIDAEALQFHQVQYNEDGTPTHSGVYNQAKMAFFYEPHAQAENYAYTNYYDQPGLKSERDNEYDEPPLLEELEIFPDKILEKIKVVLDPFKDDIPYDCDLGGPLLFYICLAVSMFISEGKLNFGYVYGISVTGCILMYMLLKLMTNSNQISIIAVASALGYSILPIVFLSVFNIIFRLNNFLGYTIACVSVVWASYAASKLLCIIAEEYSRRPLIMYPCALLYGVFTLLVIF